MAEPKREHTSEDACGAWMWHGKCIGVSHGSSMKHRTWCIGSHVPRKNLSSKSAGWEWDGTVTELTLRHILHCRENTQGPLSHLHWAARISVLAVLRTLAGVQTSKEGQTLTWANPVPSAASVPYSSMSQLESKMGTDVKHSALTGVTEMWLSWKRVGRWAETKSEAQC